MKKGGNQAVSPSVSATVESSFVHHGETDERMDGYMNG